jgi:hypothetical protein
MKYRIDGIFQDYKGIIPFGGDGGGPESGVTIEQK